MMSNQPIRILAADPPWTYNDKLKMEEDRKRSPEDFYNVLAHDDICRFLPRFFSKTGLYLSGDALLFLWATNPFILSGEAQHVCTSWGFSPKQMIPWVKGRLSYDMKGGYPHESGPALPVPKLVLQTGMGFYTRGVSEHLIVATRGEATWLVKDRGVNGLIVAPEEAFILAPRKAHSEKPKEAYDLIERLCEPGQRPFVELFARKQRPGWDCYGDQL